MATIGNLWVNIKANTRGLVRGIGGAKNSLAAFGRLMAHPAVLGVGALVIASKAWIALGKGIVRGLTLAVQESKKFNQAMAKVGAVTLTTGAGFEAMREKALLLGRTTVFTADQIAQGQLALAKAGLSNVEVNEAISATADLAAASDMDLAEATGILVNVMRAFDLKAEDTTHIADVLAITMSRSNTTIEEMGEAFSYVAPVARSLGFSLEHTSAMIGVLADAGIKGSMAGTGLRRVMSALATEIEENGVRALDDWITAQHTVSEDLLKFGLRGFNITQVLSLMRKKMIELGNAGITASNVVKKMAEMRMDTLEGDIIKLQSAWSGLKIVIGDEVEPALRQILDVSTHLINALTLSIRDWLKETDALVFSTRELETIVEGLIVSTGVAFATAVNYFNELIREARIIWNIGQIIVGLLDVAKDLVQGDMSAILGLKDLTTDVKDIGDAIQKGWFGEGGASVQELFDDVLKNFQESRKKLEEEIKATADKKSNAFLEYLGITPEDAEGMKKFDEEQLKILDKMHQFGKDLEDSWDFHGWEPFEVDAQKAINLLEQMGDEAEAISKIRGLVDWQRQLNAIVEAESEVVRLIEKGNSLWNSQLSVTETYEFQLKKLNEQHDLLNLSTEEYLLAWDGAMAGLIAKGKQIEESVMTPLEKFERDRLELESLFELQFINEETYKRKLKELEEVINDSDVKVELGLSDDAMIKGFTEGLQSALGTVNIAGEMSKTERIASKSLAIEKNMEILTTQIATSSNITANAIGNNLANLNSDTLEDIAREGNEINKLGFKDVVNEIKNLSSGAPLT